MNYVENIRTRLGQSLPNCDADLINLYTLLALVKGSNTTLEDVHDAWSVWQNLTVPDHRSLIPFEYLTKEIQELDRRYQAAISEASYS